MDSKQFEISGKELRISVLETTSPNTILKRKNSLINAMPKIIEDEGLDEILLFIVDILNEESTLLIPNENTREISKKSFNVKSS